MEVLASIFDALTLINTLDFGWAGVKDFANDSCVREYDYPEFQDLEEYVWIEIDKSGKIEILEGVADASKRKSMKAVKKEEKVLPTIEEVGETEQEEFVVPNHIIM